MKMSKNVNIYLEANPNPNSLKFVTDKILINDGIIKDYPDVESAINSPLAISLFEFKYIKRVFIMSNFITLTKNQKKFKFMNLIIHNQHQHLPFFIFWLIPLIFISYYF